MTPRCAIPCADMGSDLLRRLGGVLLLGLALGGCSRQTVRPSVPSETPSFQGNQRVPEAWHLSARLAVSNGQDGGSGRLEWTQQGEFFDVTLRAPVSGQNWQLHVLLTSQIRSAKAS